MARIVFAKKFLKKLSKIKDNSFREKIDKQIEKISDNPDIGKPMRYKRKGTRELYIDSYRLVYSYSVLSYEVVFLTIYHKDEQ